MSRYSFAFHWDYVAHCACVIIKIIKVYDVIKYFLLFNMKYSVAVIRRPTIPLPVVANVNASATPIQ